MEHIKELVIVALESTCQKRIIICEIYDKQNNLLARESNRCSPEGGICHRLGVVQNKDNYDKTSSCNWFHAEMNALHALQEGAKPYKAIIYGHNFICDNCENELLNHGVEKLEVIPEIPKL